jgi:signal transduction histidine kinase
MYRRLIILSVVIVAAVCGLSGLGYHAITKWAQGLEGTRLAEFAEVAEQIRQDVKRKLDEFIRAEQQRKYTDYLYYYVPDNMADNQQQQLVVLRSPLGDQWSNGLAYGYFQIEADGGIVTPYYPTRLTRMDDNRAVANDEMQRHVLNIENNVLPSITRRSGTLRLPEQQMQQQEMAASSPAQARQNVNEQAPDGQMPSKGKGVLSKAYPIESLKQESQAPQVFTQQRSLVASNQAQTGPGPAQPPPEMQPVPNPPADTVQAQKAEPTQRQRAAPAPRMQAVSAQGGAVAQGPAAATPQDRRGLPPTTPGPQADLLQAKDLSEMVQIRVEPFVPLVVGGAQPESSIFGGQVFLLRHVQIEDRHLLQGFQLDEHKLIAEVEESAKRFMRDGMGFDLPQTRQTNGAPEDAGEKAAYTAILDFGFGDLVLNLREIDPAWVAKRIGDLHRIYFGIIATVVAAVALALVSLWHNVRAQVKLAQKKDDFISAVSHELRTPLTSIRMYSEMLEKNWVKSQDKVAEYYRSMRQESERLSRLVENVLDFARLQKGRKRYAFQLGNLNDCIAGVVAMMKPYAEQHGFTIQTQFKQTGETPFDKDAVTQIVVNLIDNAVKYARGATDKTITVRTRGEAGFTIIEVEDRGPGVPHRQRKKVFEQFYRYGVEPTGEGPSPSPTTGTGLGLTLVKRFAEAHGGFVEIDSARPTGAIFRVALATQLSPAS